jgi:outer membrane receptor protein involved in Fe transport
MFGWFAQDRIALGSRVLLGAGARIDRWDNYHAFNRTISAAGAVSATTLHSRSDTAFSPHAAVLVRVSDRLTFNADVYRAFRAPTLQELYRGFRVGNVNTLANDQLRSEQLTGAEVGAAYHWSRSSLRAAYFWDHISDPVANVTLNVTPALITRQRQNLGATRARGFELEGESQVAEWLSVGAGYQFVNSIVLRFSADPALEGNLVPQVPRHQGTVHLHAQRSGWTASMQFRSSGLQFDDDQNLLPLSSYAAVDGMIGRNVREAAMIYIAAENIFNQRIETARTPVVAIGSPVQVRLGVRLFLHSKR